MTVLTSLNRLGSITDLVAGTRWDGARLKSEVLDRAAFLEAEGIKPGDPVLITHGGTAYFFADLLALWQLGAVAACLNPALTKNELETIAHFVEPKACLRGPGERTRGLEGVLEFDLAGKKGNPDHFKPRPVKPEDPALILFTSGTTGNPKGVVHSFGSLTNRLENNWKHLPKETLGSTLCVLPTHFGHGLIGNCLTPLFKGADLHLYPRPGIAGAAGLGQVIAENAITFLSSVPSFWKVVLKTSKPPETQSLKQISVGSAPLTSGLWRAIQEWAGIANVVNMYGITETANWAAGYSAAGGKIEDGIVGRMWGGEAAVLAEDGSFQPNGEGEILLKTPSLMAGYFKREDLTKEVLQNGWYKTGDWGTVSKDGQIRLKGRTKTEINKAGIKILPEEIDMLLEKNPEIAEACAFAIPDPISGETVAAAISLKVGASLDIPGVRAWCRERIRPDAVPEKWFFIPEIPKTDRGKINRAMVREFCLKGEG